jgi:alanyl-tRNA synthetase
MKSSVEIRKEFIDFFVNKYAHSFVKSSPVAPLDDPSLLFTNAGMNQFKDVFLGKSVRSYSRAVNSQKVIRASGKHNDLEDVGYDTYHHTFFEMLGNWSFGDYYKAEAITWAWELLTHVWGLPKERLWATVHTSDSEAFDLWSKLTDINPAHILYFGDKENFWEMGATGPCGPCTEIHFDKGTNPAISGADKEQGVNTDNPQFMEIWNLVFMQNFRNEDRSLSELPAKHVDTGMGFERIVSVIQNKNSNYDTDIFQPLIVTIEKLSGKKYEGVFEIPMRIAADHIRTLSFSIADGAMPSNEGRGYVLRRMLRRAAKYGRQLGFYDPYLYKIVDTLVAEMSGFYPELLQQADLIKRVIKSEEEQFARTLDKGLGLFSDLAKELNKNSTKIVAGKDAFKLYDTYGFPLDLTQIIAKESGFTVDEAEFHTEMEKQRARARSAGMFNISHEEKRTWIELSTGTHSVFKGYEQLNTTAEIRKYAVLDDKIYFVLSETTFYAESGGQVGDKGFLKTISEEFEIIDVQKEGDYIIHIANNNFLIPSEKKIQTNVSESLRRSTANNHTATHLLHKALTDVLGSHIKQAGSLVEPDRLRFDFSHFEKITDSQLSDIELRVNNEILNNTKLSISEVAYNDAISSGVTALFGEKYGVVVRVVKVGDYSKELCGGTHVIATGQIGSFQIISEASIASGVRRIEAVTGIKSFEKFAQNRFAYKSILHNLSATPDQVDQKINHLIDDKKRLEKELAELKEQMAIKASANYLSEVELINGIKILAKEVNEIDTRLQKIIAANLILNQTNTIIVISSILDSKISLTVAVSADLQKTYQAGKIVSEMAKLCGGGGGGKADIASAGGKDINKIPEVFKYVKDLVK